MTDKVEPDQWRVLSESVRGATHERKKLENQDAIEVWPSNDQGEFINLPIILAVSDGHGSPKSFRSHIGSRLAVEETVEILKALVDKENAPDNLKAVKEYAENKLPQQLVQSWREQVKNDLNNHPITDEHLDELAKKDGYPASNAVEKDNFLAYGATLLAVLVTEQYILYLQLGDGDILCVNTNGETTRALEKDETLIANETYSLCLKGAENYFQVSFVSPMDSLLSMLLLSTDGYANSFANEEDFMKIGRDYKEMIREEGCDKVQKQLKEFLEQTSRGGSGDDITLGIIKKREDQDCTDQIKSLKQDVSDLRENDQDFIGKVENLTEKTEEHDKRMNEIDEQSKNKIEELKENNKKIEEEFQQELKEIDEANQKEQEEQKKKMIDVMKTIKLLEFCLLIIAVISIINLWFLLERKNPGTTTPNPDGALVPSN